MALENLSHLACVQCARAGSDMEDVSASPNDPLFISHHANVDRSHHHWMFSMMEHGKDVYTSFPQDRQDVRPEVVSSQAPHGGSGPYSTFGLCVAARLKSRT